MLANLIICRLKIGDVRNTDYLEIDEFKFSLKSWLQGYNVFTLGVLLPSCEPLNIPYNPSGIS